MVTKPIRYLLFSSYPRPVCTRMILWRFAHVFTTTKFGSSSLTPVRIAGEMAMFTPTMKDLTSELPTIHSESSRTTTRE